MKLVGIMQKECQNFHIHHRRFWIDGKKLIRIHIGATSNRYQGATSNRYRGHISNRWSRDEFASIEMRWFRVDPWLHGSYQSESSQLNTDYVRVDTIRIDHKDTVRIEPPPISIYFCLFHPFFFNFHERCHDHWALCQIWLYQSPEWIIDEEKADLK